MAAEKKQTQRDETLIKVLDRLSDSIAKQDERLDEISKTQLSQLADMERNESRQLMRLDTTEGSIEKTQEAISRYRSDMLSLVNEQDRMNEIIKDMSKKQASLAYTQDGIISALAGINARLEETEKLVREVNIHSIRHEELLPKEIASMNRSVSKLHMDTEKRLGDAQKETQDRLEKIKLDVERRLLALDKIESSLDVLLIRTEPPEKKPFIILRILLRLRVLINRRKFRVKKAKRKPRIPKVRRRFFRWRKKQ